MDGNVGRGLPLCTAKRHCARVSDKRIPVSFANEIPAGEDRERRVCQTCGFVDYVNPRIVSGVELGETVEEGALREAREEACAELEIETMLGLYSIPRIGQVQVFFRARLLNTPAVGPESEEVTLAAWDDVPWKELAFPSVHWALDHYRETQGRTGFAPFGNPPGTDHLTK